MTRVPARRGIGAAAGGLLAALRRRRDQMHRAQRVTRLVLKGLVSSDIPRMAAALSYRTIFSLVPVLVVGVAVLGSVLTEERLQAFVSEVMERVGLSQIELSEEAFGGVGPMGPVGPGLPAGPVTGEGTVAVVDASATRLDAWITRQVERVRSLRLDAIGGVGVLVLIWAAIGMLVELERAFDTICHAPTQRRWSRRVTTYWTILTLGVLLLLATFTAGDRAAEWIAGHLPESTRSGVAGQAAGTAINLLINVGLLVFAYSTVPNTRLRLANTLAGGVVAGVLFEIAKSLFTLYLSGGGLEKLYGALALLPLFMIWVYFTWNIVLLGLQIAYATQHFDVWLSRFDASHAAARPRIADPGVALAAAVTAARRFARGEPTRPVDAAEPLGLDETTAADILSRLCDVGLLRRVDDDEDAFTLAAPAETLAADVALGVGEGLAASPTDAAARAVLEPFAAQRRARVAGRTLAEVAGLAGGDVASPKPVG